MHSITEWYQKNMLLKVAVQITESRRAWRLFYRRKDVVLSFGKVIFFPHWVGRAFGNKNLITKSFRTRSGETGSELFSVVGLETAAYERPMSLLWSVEKAGICRYSVVKKKKYIYLWAILVFNMSFFIRICIITALYGKHSVKGC